MRLEAPFEQDKVPRVYEKEDEGLLEAIDQIGGTRRSSLREVPGKALLLLSFGGGFVNH